MMDTKHYSVGEIVTTPRRPEELMLEVGAVYRVIGSYGNGSYRLQRLQESMIVHDTQILNYPEIAMTLDFGAKRATWQGIDIYLSKTEWRVLSVLANHVGAVVDVDDVLAVALGKEYVNDHQYLRVWISRLRHKLPALPLVSVKGIGYRLEIPPMPLATDAVAV